MTKRPAETTKTYLMECKDGGLRRITVPSSWKVTFGPLVPPKDRAPHSTSSDRGFALRFYEGKDQQRAVFTDVVAFRDESLVVQERVTRTRSKASYKDTAHGKKEVVMQASITEWVDPLAPDDNQRETFEQLTHDTAE